MPFETTIEEVNAHKRQRKLTIALILFAFLFFVIIRLFSPVLAIFYNPLNHLAFHTSLELFSIIVSFAIAIQAWMIFPHTMSRRRLLLGGIFFSIAFLDLFHTLTFKGMPYFFGESSVQKATWFWILARMTQTVGLLYVFSLKDKEMVSTQKYVVFLTSTVYTVLLTFTVFLFENQLPTLVIDGQGTTAFKNGVEYFLCVLIAINIWLLVKEYRGTKNIALLTIISALAFIFFSELVFTSYTYVTDVDNFLGHIYKVIGFYLLLKGIYFSTIEEPYLKQKKTEKQLRNSEHKLQVITSSLGEGILVAGLDGKVNFLNPEAERLLGYKENNIKGKQNLDQICCDQNDIHVSLIIEQHIKNGERFEVDFTYFKRSDGSLFPGSLIATPLYENMKVAGVVMAFNNITARIEQQQALEESEARFRSIVETLPCGITIVDQEGNHLFSNDIVEDIFGIKQETILERTILDSAWELRTLEDEPFDQEKFGIKKVFLTGEPLSNIQCKVTHADGHDLYLSINSAPLFNTEGKVTRVINAITDITEKVKSEEKVRFMAFHDHLTGLPNRMKYSNVAQNAIEEAEQLNQKAAFVFFDINRFKNINDTLGHKYGDLYLKTLSTKFKLVDDVVIARMGGDEFTLLIPNVSDLKVVNKTVDRIIKIIEEPFIIRGQEFRLTASAGISLFPNDGSDIDILMSKADIAMYRAKQSKVRLAYYSSNMDQNAYEVLVLEQELRKAIIKQELTVFYQPQLNLQSDEIIGFEALVRWKHPKKGMISPAQFIPIAEETGLIIEIGDMVLKQACSQLKSWHKQGNTSLIISVNLSMLQFFDTDLPEKIEKTLNEVSLHPRFLQLEITESMAMDAEQTVKVLNRLKEIGVQIAVDDFGTGYSSFSNLKTFPIDLLKIDRSFIQQLDQQNRPIVSTIISMANHLDMRVIAEGVETEEQLQFLKENGCDDIQGYLLSPPLPPEEIEKQFFERQHANYSK